jgi:hypothetical protein
MKRPSSDLHKLITSLNQKEKIQFRKYVAANALGESPVYKKLFDAIAKQEEYDEQELKRNFKKERFVIQFAVAKNYLYRLILKSLEAYMEDPEREISSMINQTEILLGKGLYTACLSMIKRTKKRIYKQERQALLPRLIRMEWSLFLRNNLRKIEENYDDQLLKEVRLALRITENEFVYHHIYSKIYVAGQKAGVSRDPEQLEELENMMQNALLKDESNALSERAKNSIYKSLSSHAFVTGNPNLYYRSMKKTVKQFEKFSEIFSPSTYSLLNTYNNLSNACIYTKRMKEAMQITDRMGLIETKTIREKVLQFELVSLARVNIYGLSFQFEKASQIMQHIDTDYEKYRLLMTPVIRLILPSSCAYLCIINRDYKTALLWVNRGLNEPEEIFRKDSLSILRILDCLIHYEMEHIDLLEYKLKSVYRKLLSKNNLYRTERCFLDGLKKLIATNNQKEKTDILQKTKAGLEELKKDSKERAFFENINLLSWIESKLTGRPFADTIRAYSKN